MEMPPSGDMPPSGRVVEHRYMDPLDQVWLGAAAKIGLVIARSNEVYASTDGAGTLTLGAAHTLDADDCLAQMIFHELCHALIQGPESFSREDWGLDNMTARDVVREHACLRLQAVLAAEHGLRRVLAPTTDFRSFYDALAPDPLLPRYEPSVQLAIAGLQRVDTPPWGPHLREALAATSAIAQVATRYASQVAAEPEQHPSLWSLVVPPAERHPVGFALSVPASESNQSFRSCGTCAWYYVGGPGKPQARCRQAKGTRIAADWPACDRWERVLDCQECGACCRGAYDSVTVPRRDPAVKAHPALVVDRGSYVEMRRVPDAHSNRCVALTGGELAREGTLPVWKPYACVIYDDRPRPCREFERGGAHCLTARRRVALSR